MIFCDGKLGKPPKVINWKKTNEGIVRTYYPDFLIRLDNGNILVLETKKQDTPQVQAKRDVLTAWLEAVNNLKDYGLWHSDISFNTADVDGIIEKHIG
jgi:type III restriction enzyme